MWIAVLGMIVSAGIALLSHLSVRKAEQTGRANFLFWQFANRSGDSALFNRKQKFDEARTLFFGVLTLVFAAYFLEALGAFNR
jgi:hypothetical protein